jgi:5-dehydro-2-deoxygluconokinase
VEAVDYARYGALITTGTVFAAEPSRSAAFRAFELARAAGLPMIFDIDYRPYSWPSPQVAEEVYSRAGAMCDVIVGNDVEFGFMAGDYDRASTRRASWWRTARRSPSTRWARRARSRSRRRRDHAPASIRTEALKPTGAGDSFMGGFVRAWPKGANPRRRAARLGRAAMVVARSGCAPAMPTREELDAFLRDHPGPTAA